jgi:hypothetical protein
VSDETPDFFPKPSEHNRDDERDHRRRGEPGRHVRSVRRQVRAALAGRTLLLAGGLAMLVLLGGCGASKPKPEARVLAEANAFCRSLAKGLSVPTPGERARAGPTSIADAIRHAFGHLPAGKALYEALAKRQALIAEMKQLRSGGSYSGLLVARSLHQLERSYQLGLQIYDDEKALGLTSCLGRPPRPPISG